MLCTHHAHLVNGCLPDLFFDNRICSKLPALQVSTAPVTVTLTLQLHTKTLAVCRFVHSGRFTHTMLSASPAAKPITPQLCTSAQRARASSLPQLRASCGCSLGHQTSHAHSTPASKPVSPCATARCQAAATAMRPPGTPRCINSAAPALPSRAPPPQATRSHRRRQDVSAAS